MQTKQINLIVAFKHKADSEKAFLDRMMSKAIQFWTKSKYYHTEIVIDKTWVSAIPNKGVSLNKVSLDFSPNWEYLTLTVEVTEQQQALISKYVLDQAGCKYDWSGIFWSQFIKLGAQSDSKWFCSELVTKILQLYLVPEVLEEIPHKVSPAGLFTLLSGSIKNNKA